MVATANSLAPQSPSPLNSLALAPGIQDTYAGLVAGLWTNISPQQDVLITGDSCHSPFMDRIRLAALDRGARNVYVVPRDFAADREVVEQSDKPDAYTAHFGALAEASAKVAATKGCFIRVEGRGEPDILEGLNGGRLNGLETARSLAIKPIQSSSWKVRLSAVL